MIPFFKQDTLSDELQKALFKLHCKGFMWHYNS